MKTVKLIATGDVMQKRRLRDIPSRDNAEVQAALDLLRAADLALINLEQPLSHRGVAGEKWAAARGLPETAQDLPEMGVDVVSLANNHMVDFGPEALADTLTVIDEVKIAHCGAGANLADALAPAICEREGWRIGVLGLASTLPIGSAATDTRPGVAPVKVTSTYEIEPSIAAEQPGMVPIAHTFANEKDMERVLAEITSIRRKVDYLIVSIHWGVPSYWMTPYGGLLAEYQPIIAHQMIDAGADLIHGHHPHAPQGFELYRDKLICYSLGNFLFEWPKNDFMSQEAFVVEVTLAPESEPRVEICPIWVNDAGLPATPTAEQHARVVGTLAKLSAPLGVQLEPAEGGRLQPKERHPSPSLQ